MFTLLNNSTHSGQCIAQYQEDMDVDAYEENLNLILFAVICLVKQVHLNSVLFSSLGRKSICP